MSNVQLRQNKGFRASARRQRKDSCAPPPPDFLTRLPSGPVPETLSADQALWDGLWNDLPGMLHGIETEGRQVPAACPADAGLDLQLSGFRRDWINPVRRRHYAVIVEQDLLGDWVMIRYWGSMDTRRGGEKVDLLPDGPASALSRLLALGRRRKSRGYEVRPR